MNKPTNITELVRDMFPKCLHCGKPVMDELDMVLATEHPHRVAHLACQKAKNEAAA